MPTLPAGGTKLVPALRALRLLPSFHFLESVVTTAVVGRDQGYLAQPWVRARAMEIDTFGVSPFDFTIGAEAVERLHESGRRAATEFLERWSFDGYVERHRQPLRPQSS